MTLKRISEFGLSLVLSLSSLLVIAVPKAYAANITWDGGTDGNLNFTDGENWVGDVAPTDADVLVFPSGVTNNDPVNDMGATVFGGIEFGAIASFECPNSGTVFDFSGSSIQLSGNVVWQINSCAVANFDAGITLTTNATIDTNEATETITLGAVSLGSNTLTVNNDGAFVAINGVVTGTGGITKVGTDYLALGGNNLFSGPVTISAGSVNVEHANGLGTSAAGTTVASGAFLGFCFTQDITVTEPLTLSGNGADSSLSVAGCGGSSPLNKTATFTGPITLASNVKVGGYNNNIAKITGALSGNFTIGMAAGQQASLVIDSSNNTSLTQNGTSNSAPKETVYSANSPATSISVGSNNIAVVTGTYGDVSVASSGILKGNGTVGNVNMQTGGKLAPGMSPGCINTGSLGLAGTLEVEIGGVTECTGYDRTNVTGTVNLTNGTLSVLKFNNFVPTAGQVYQIIANDAADAVTGAFTNLAEGATLTVDGVVYRVSYVGGDGNDVTLTVVSVPAAPDTGFQMLTNNPLATFAATVLAAVAIMGIARKYSRVTVRR